ncbi:unnamed protein product [Fusarium graminearum]|nr:unnamed protein product [Fusarium graminearum]
MDDNVFLIEIYIESSIIKGPIFPLSLAISATYTSTSSVHFITMLEHGFLSEVQLLMLVLLIDTCAIIIRVSEGEWTPTSKRFLLCSALYVEPHKRVGYITLLTECDGPGSNLTATLGPVNAAHVSQFDTRREINVMMWNAVAAAGGTVIMGVLC